MHSYVHAIICACIHMYPCAWARWAGDVVIVPELWGHATINLEPSLGWASEFIFDRSYDDGLAASHGVEWWRTGERDDVQEGARDVEGARDGVQGAREEVEAREDESEAVEVGRRGARRRPVAITVGEFA